MYEKIPYLPWINSVLLITSFIIKTHSLTHFQKHKFIMRCYWDKQQNFKPWCSLIPEAMNSLALTQIVLPYFQIEDF